MEIVTVYVWTFDRRRQAVERLLDHFVARRSACTDEYEYPQYADQRECVFTDDTSILNRLETDKNASYSLYWNVTEQRSKVPVEQAIAIYTTDGGVIVGMVVPESHARTTLEEFHRIFGVEWGIVTGEEFPSDNASRFQEICRCATLPHIVGGRILG